MNSFSRWLTAAGFVVFELGAAAFGSEGRNDGHRSIDLKETVVALGTRVAPGSYTLRWSREVGSENVRVEITRGRKIVASGRGVWVQASSLSPYEALVYHNDSGTH